MLSTSLAVIALISGGKDSLFSLLHCIQNGHKIIALANLYPASTAPSKGEIDVATVEGEDVNSFMYQTVGHTIIPLYAEALALPLYRRQISGTAVNTRRQYAFSQQSAPDETEDLVPLLQEIKQAHPEANALSTGAILSTYQRTRIESVAVRLRLTPVAYLWQYPALPPPIERDDSLTGLLDDMEAAGCDARLIKIASAGIKDSLLGSRISDPSVVSRIIAGMSRFVEGNESSLRGAVLGEGGEYETLAVHGLPPLWKKRIGIDSIHNAIVQEAGGTTRLAFSKAVLAEQSATQADDNSKSPPVRVPVLLDDKFRSLVELLLQAEKIGELPLASCDIHEWPCPGLKQNTSQVSTNFIVSNLTDPRLSKHITAQTIAIVDQLDAIISSTFYSSDVNPPCVIATTILLRYMSDFAAVNAVYGARFDHINPPTRVAICCGDNLPQDVLVSISFTLTKVDPAKISGLHVQSISYWAPANIGPYSQAISVPALPCEACEEVIVHLAGQIPLVPSSMGMLEGDFLNQAVLSLQHLWRVGQCVGIDWWTHGVAYLADADVQEIQRRAKVAWEVWRGANAPASNPAEDEDIDCTDDLDAWDLKHNHQLRQPWKPSRHSADSHLHTLPNQNVVTRRQSSIQMTPTTIPPFLAAHVSSLPRSAPIEWHSLGLARLSKYPASKPRLTVSTEIDEYSSTSTCHIELVGTRAESDSGEESPTTTDKQRKRPRAVPIEFFSIQIFATEGQPSLSSKVKDSLRTALSRLETERDDGATEGRRSRCFRNLTIYTSSQAGHDAITATSLAGMGTSIPCRSLWGEEGRRVEVAVVGSWEREEATKKTEGGKSREEGRWRKKREEGKRIG